jgi:tetratricopeptide (TPR) repeat protein/CHAT domain-containing protein
MDRVPHNLKQLQREAVELKKASRFKEAIATARKIADLTKLRSGREHLDYIVSLNNLAELYQEVADYAAAEQTYLNALTILDTDMPSDPRLLSAVLGNLARVYQETGRFENAEPLLQRALRLARDTRGHQGRELATAANNMAGFYSETGRLAQIEPLYQEALDALQRSLPEEHPDIATALNNLGTFYFSIGRLREAGEFLERSLEIRRQALAPNHPDIAQSLSNSAARDLKLGNLASATARLREALDIRLKVFGEMHPNVATALDNLASVLKSAGQYEESERLFRKALEIREGTLGPNHQDVALSLNHLATTQISLGNYAAAKPTLIRALALYEQLFGDSNIRIAATLGNFARLYYEIGDYQAAVPLFNRALEIRRQALGSDHPDVALSLDNLAALYREMGAFEKAEPLFLEALRINNSIFGPNHPDVAVSLNNLAALYRDMGDYVTSESYLHRALEINRTVLSAGHPTTATSMHNLAGLYRAMGRDEEAERLYREALETTRRALGENHPSIAQTLSGLGALHYSRKHFPAALSLMQEVVAIRRQALGDHHPLLANSLNNLAQTLSDLGEYAAAEPLLIEAIAVWTATLGSGHPDVAIGSGNLAALYVATGRKDLAFEQLHRASTIIDGVIEKIFSIGSERRRLTYLTMIRRMLDLLLSLASSDRSTSLDWKSVTFEVVLRRKGLGAEALAAQRDAVLGGKHPELASQLQTLTTLRRQIARKMLDGPGLDGPGAYSRLLVEWGAEREQLEAKLAAQIPELRMEQQLRTANLQAIAERLPSDAVLIEFVCFSFCDFKAVPARGERRWQPVQYLAFVLPAKQPDRLKMVPLGEAESIEQALAEFRNAIGGGGRHVGPSRKHQPIEETDARGAKLRRLIFDPLLPHLGGRTRLFLALDGELTRLPFEVLPTMECRRLIDDYSISYLGCGRDLLRFSAASSGAPAEPLVAAGPDFDLGGAPATPAEAPPAPGRRSRDLKRGSDRSLVLFDKLKGAEEEGRQIAMMLGVKPKLGDEVLETTIKAHHSPFILHLSTHGCFLPDRPRDPNADHLDVALSPVETAGRWPRLAQLENPLLRSFLAVAGANTWLRGGMLPEAAEDGMLNAEDVSGLDLLGTELVVLSACETALGSVQVGEGVFGLQRAFVVAGAKTLVMSQWEVPDAETRELMEEFYRRVLAGKERAEGLRCAQLALKAKHPDNPDCWGAFICLGDPGPLPQRGPPTAT